MGDAFGSGVVHYRSQKELQSLDSSAPPTPRQSIVSTSKDKEDIDASTETATFNQRV